MYVEIDSRGISKIVFFLYMQIGFLAQLHIPFNPDYYMYSPTLHHWSPLKTAVLKEEPERGKVR